MILKQRTFNRGGGYDSYPLTQTAFTLAEGATHVAIQHNNRKAAFTLAEVLITLAVIGIVATMTIPNLVQSYKKKEVETKLVKFYSTINQAIKLSEVDNGDAKTWDEFTMETIERDDGTKYYKSDIKFVEKYFAPYIKNLKLSLPENTAGSTYPVMEFYDGSAVIFRPSSTSIHYFIDQKALNDFLKFQIKSDGTYTYKKLIGTKMFTFQYFPKEGRIEPWRWGCQGTDEELRNNNEMGCKKEGTTNEPACCTELIRRNGWKIPDDYPFKF